MASPELLLRKHHCACPYIDLRGGSCLEWMPINGLLAILALGPSTNTVGVHGQELLLNAVAPYNHQQKSRLHPPCPLGIHRGKGGGTCGGSHVNSKVHHLGQQRRGVKVNSGQGEAQGHNATTNQAEDLRMSHMISPHKHMQSNLF